MVIWHTWDRVFIHHLADQVQSFCDFHWEVVSILQVLHQHLLFDQLCLRLLFLHNFFNLITAVVMWRILTVLTWARTYIAHLFVSSTEDTRETGTVQGILTLLFPSHSDTFREPGYKNPNSAIRPSYKISACCGASSNTTVWCSRDMPAWYKGMVHLGQTPLKCWWGYSEFDNSPKIDEGPKREQVRRQTLLLPSKVCASAEFT